MIDALLHIILGIVIGALTWLAFQFGPFAGAGLVGALVVYLREVTHRVLDEFDDESRARPRRAEITGDA